MAKPHVDLLVVCQDNAMAGIITKTDIVALAGRSFGPGLTDPVDAVMVRDVAHCRTTDPLVDIWEIMKKRGFQRVPVVSGTHVPIGVLYSRDVLQGLLCDAQIEDEVLREYISGVGYR
jgi:CBS domain-containing protein